MVRTAYTIGMDYRGMTTEGTYAAIMRNAAEGWWNVEQQYNNKDLIPKDV
jgi:hypothetical protein